MENLQIFCSVSLIQHNSPFLNGDFGQTGQQVKIQAQLGAF